MQTCTLHDLGNHGPRILKSAEIGELTVVTEQGQPVFVAVPFDDLVLNRGIRFALAVRLFEEEALSTGQAAEFAGVSLAEFMETCSSLDVPVVRYSPEELDKEMEVLNEWRRR
ncbi:MAG: UPF0175 family protein [Pseudomonadota bacterium]